MPITDIQCDGGVFFAREVGCVDGNDARQWAEALVRCAQASPTPIVVVVDAVQARTITADARRIFAKASETPNIRVAAVATGNTRVMQQSRITALMSMVRSTHETHFFNTLQEAEQFASSHLSPPAYSG